MKNSTVSVLGLGNWGTALANHLARRGNTVTAWSIEEDIVEGVNAFHRNPKFLSHVKLHSNLKATTELPSVLDNEVLLFVLPSAALPEVCPKLSKGKFQTFISAVKGIVPDSLETPLQYARHHLPQGVATAVISGPSFAIDVIAGKPCGIVAASEKESTAQEVAELFLSDTMKMYPSTDPLGVELGGILKNVIALAVGVCDGIGLGDSARAGLITRGLAEITRLAVAMGANERTLSGLSGLGDLLMTSTCDTSRNRTVGLRLGKGERLDHIITTLGSVAEGVKTTPLVMKLAEQHQVEMPICTQASRLISGEVKPEEIVQLLVTRPMRKEFDE